MSASARADGEPKRGQVLALVVLGFFVFFLGLGDYSVVNGDEGFYHTVAALMLERGDWLYLDFHGEHRVYDTFMNAPTQYWARAALIALVGDNLWSMRLLSAAFGLGTVLAVHTLGREVAGRRAGWFAALAMLTCFQFVFLHGARTGELDAIVAFVLTITALLFLRGLRDGTGFALHHVCLALLLTIKVPAIAMPLLAELALFATTPSARASFRRWAATGLAIVPLGLVWHAFQSAWWWDQLVDVVSRMGDEAAGVGADKVTGTPLENALWYAERILYGAFPWSLAMVPGTLAALAAARGRSQGALGRRVVLWALVGVLGFFVFVGKRFPWYIQPAYPFLAVCVGAWLATLGERARLTALFGVAGVVAFGFCVTVPLDTEPMTVRAPLFPMEVGWRALPRVSDAVAALVVFALALGGLALGWWTARERFWRVLPGLLFAALLGYAVLRVGYPLASLEHTSELERLYDDVEARRAEGRKVGYPVRIPEDQGYLKITYYFGRDYRLRRERGADGPVVFVDGVKRPKPEDR